MSDLQKIDVIPFTEGDTLYNKMLKAIEQSKDEIMLESYIFNFDSIGKRFVEALNKKAQQMVSIRIHLDAVGSRYFHQHQILKKALDRRIQLKWFHRWSFKRPLQFNVRNHRKLLIIDRKLVFTGGANIHQECSQQFFGDKRWRDTHVLIVSGSASLFAQYFEDFWYKKRQKYLGGLLEFDLIPNLTQKCRYLFRCRLTQVINRANKSLLCTTPYFVPDDFLLRALITAAQRGVEVRLLVPLESDHPLVNVMANQYYSRLLQYGIKVNAYLPRLLHAKTLVIDSSTVLIGSANMDYRSLFINHELNCLFNSQELAQEMTQIFENDSKHSIAVTPKKPIKAIRFWWVWRPVAALLKHWI